MLLNILKCDGCKKEIEYTDIHYTDINKLLKNGVAVGKFFKYYKNKNKPENEPDRYTKFHLCNSCFDALKEKLDNVISEFKGDNGKHDSCDCGQ